MAVNNSLPVRLSDVIAEFGGGAGAPKNLGAYRAGAGYVPSGSKGGSAAIPTPNGAIPSSFPLNLGSFPGAKKELTITQYWPYKDYYHRSIYYRTSSPPATAAHNDDQTAHWNNYPTSYYINNQVLWQKMSFANAGNSSLPDSGQCTVVYLVNASNTSYSNTMSNGTSLSVRALDATGASHHVSPIAYGKYNFVTDGTQSDSAMVWATYNFSMKRITDVYCALTDTNDQGAWDNMLILPGAKKVGSYVITKNNTGYDIKPSSPINVDEVVIGMKFDGGGNYEIQYQNPTFANPLRQCGWWYHNSGIIWEANCTSGPVTLTTTVPQDYTPSNVWAIMVDNVGGSYAAGVSPIWPSWIFGLSVGATGSITIKRNGGVTAVKAGVTQDLPSQSISTCPENWYLGTTLQTMPGDNYWVRLTPSTGSTGTASGPTGWTRLNSDQTWSFTADGTSCMMDINIADNAAGNNPKYLGYVSFASAGGGGGGGGGGGCVEFTSYLPGGARADQMVVGSTMQLADHETLEPNTGEVTYSEQKVMPGFRITTENGATLRCSSNAPIPTRSNGYKTPMELYGDQVAVRRDVDGEIQMTWEQVTGVESIGLITVQHITVGDRCFWAGEQENAFILHHNLKQVTDANAAN